MKSTNKKPSVKKAVKAIKEVFKLSLETTAFINTEIMPELEGMNNAVIKKDEFLLSTSELVAELFIKAKDEKQFNVQFWNAVFSHIETQAVSKFKIAESTAKNYTKDIVAFLKIRKEPILKPASENKDAKRKALKKKDDEKIIKKYSKVAVETLEKDAKDLIFKDDKESISKFKELTLAISDRKETEKQLKETQAKNDKAKFKENYFKDFKDIFENEYELAQFIHAKIDSIRKEHNKQK